MPTNTWSVAGNVLETVSRQAVAGATVTPSWVLAAVSANASGEFSLGAVANPPTTPYKVTTAADGFVTRELWVNWQAGARTGVTLDLIRNAAPFSMDFYKQLVRGSFDHEGAPWPVLRWVAAPKFYLRTVDQNGRAIEPEVLPVIRDALLRSVPLFTGGLYSASVETGTETRPDTAGWINVYVRRDPTERAACGWSWVGRDPGEITLIHDLCSCGSNKVPGELVLHEVGHALGFFHVADSRSVMNKSEPVRCGFTELSPLERYHSAIAYQRPRGNTDPDNDPSSARVFAPGGTEGPPTRVRN